METTTRYYSIDKDLSQDENKKDLEKEHAYIGSEYLYLKDKLQKNSHYTNLRGIKYKEEKMKTFDRIYYVLYVIYWILYTCYGLLFIFKEQYYEVTSVIILILMGAFPFFIHKLSLFLIKQIKELYKKVKETNIYIPSFKAEETIEEIEKNLRQSSSNLGSLKSNAKKGMDGLFSSSKKFSNSTYERQLKNLLENDDNLKRLTAAKKEVEDKIRDDEEIDLKKAQNGWNVANAEILCGTQYGNNEDYNDLCKDYKYARDAYHDVYSNYEDNLYYWVKETKKPWTKQKLNKYPTE